MWTVLWLIFFSFIHSTECDCSGNADICEWTPWESWGSCSSSCGGGSRKRARPACCKKSLSFDQCMKECNMDKDDQWEYRSCNNYCYHGRFHYEKTDKYSYGRCICVSGYGGGCCDIGRLRYFK